MNPVVAPGWVSEPRRPDHPGIPRAAERTAPEEPGRALVSVVPLRPALESRTAFVRPSAVFLAQLIAASRNLAQARERRRAEPHEAIAAYTAATRVA